MAKFLIDESMWAGTESALCALLERMAANEERMQAGVYPQQAAVELPYLLKIEGDKAIINISGPMSNSVSYWDRMDNAATYPAIREALINAATNPEVAQIILDINSGGGSVSGVADVSALISDINAKVKPVTAFTDGNMMSAAYWLGSSAGKVYASKVAGVGSIGVIATHREASKMYEDMGIKTTVVRAGKFKALANSAEPLTDAGREQIQSAVDATYTVFTQHVADMRGVNYAKADSTMAQGREFYGEQALSAGLVDGIHTFDSMMSKLSVDKNKGSSHNSQNVHSGNFMKTALTEQQIAALAAGAPVVAATATVETPAVAAPATPAAVVETPAPAAVPAAVVAATVPATVVAAPAEASIVAYLQGQVATKDAALLAANLENSQLKAQVTDYEASISGLKTIAAKSTNNMRIALGGSALDMTSMTATAILAEHESFAKQFTEKFVAGGVAAVDAVHAEKEVTGKPDAFSQARLAAVRSTTRKI